jgi:hypothetical protein
MDNLSPSQSDFDSRRVGTLEVKDAHLSDRTSHRLNNMCGKAITLRLMPRGTEIHIGVNESVPFDDGHDHEEHLRHTKSGSALLSDVPDCFMEFEVDGHCTVISGDSQGIATTAMGCHFAELSRPSVRPNVEGLSSGTKTPLVDAPSDKIFLVIKIEKDSSGQNHVNVSSPMIFKNMTDAPVWLAASTSELTSPFEILSCQTLVAPLQWCSANTKISVSPPPPYSVHILSWLDP